MKTKTVFSVGDVVTYKVKPRGGWKIEFEVMKVLPNSLKLWHIHPERDRTDCIYVDPSGYKLVRKASKLHKVLE